MDGEWRSWFESTRHVYMKTEWKHIISAFFSSSEIGIGCCKCLLSRHIFAIYANINETSCNIFYRSSLFSENRIQKVYAFRYRKKICHVNIRKSPKTSAVIGLKNYLLSSCLLRSFFGYFHHNNGLIVRRAGAWRFEKSAF